MESDDVVVLAPLLDEDPSLLEAAEDLAVEKFVPQFANDLFWLVLASHSIPPSWSILKLKLGPLRRNQISLHRSWDNWRQVQPSIAAPL